MSEFLETILILFLIFFALRLIFRLFGRQILNFFLKKLTQRAQRQFKERMGSFGATDASEDKEDQRRSHRSTKNNKKERVGEYIDYEEIE